MKEPINGQKLRALRQEKGLTQVALAARAGLDTSTIRELEHGRQVPHGATVQALCRALGVKAVTLAPTRL